MNILDFGYDGIFSYSPIRRFPFFPLIYRGIALFSPLLIPCDHAPSFLSHPVFMWLTLWVSIRIAQGCT